MVVGEEMFANSYGACYTFEGQRVFVPRARPERAEIVVLVVVSQ
jgi:organic hydroperoxide reductase OsmC/OhrA